MDELPIFTGMEVGYYFICVKKLWWFAHGVTMEQEHDRVRMGKLVHEESYARRKKELNIDARIVLYYLYYLKRRKGVEGLRGQINYPKLRETKEVELTPEREAEIEAALGEMRRIVGLRSAPAVEWMKICRSCSYADLCWG